MILKARPELDKREAFVALAGGWARSTMACAVWMARASSVQTPHQRLSAMCRVRAELIGS
jgi:hypothetical protein